MLTYRLKVSDEDRNNEINKKLCHFNKVIKEYAKTSCQKFENLSIFEYNFKYEAMILNWLDDIGLCKMCDNFSLTFSVIKNSGNDMCDLTIKCGTCGFFKHKSEVYNQRQPSEKLQQYFYNLFEYEFIS